ncbi:MAG: methyltransferase [Myxococcota bacterium]
MNVARTVFLLRNVLAGLPAAAAIAFAFARGATPVGAAPWVAGALLATGGVVLRAWAACHNAYGGGRPKTLAVDGPYAWVRNPLYLANAAIVAGAVALAARPAFAPASFAWAIAVFAVVVRREEERLRERYADAYAAYAERVGRWLPVPPRGSAGAGRVRVGATAVLRAIPGQSGGLALLALAALARAA